MRKVKLVVHEVYRGDRSPEGLIAELIVSRPALTAEAAADIMELTKPSQDSLCSGKGTVNGRSDE